MATEPFLVNPVRRHRRRRARPNPVGDELVILGLGNPRHRRRRRKGVSGMARRTRRRYARRRRRAMFFGNDPGPRRRRRRRYRSNPRRRRASYRWNEPARRRRRRRGYRRNPAERGLQLARFETWLPLVMTGTGSAVVTALVPRFFGPAVTVNMSYLIQAGVAAAGGVMLPMMGFRPIHGVVWFIVGGAVILADLAKRWVLPMMGLAAYPYETYAALSAMGQEPYYPPALQQADYEEPETEMAAYPYEEGVAGYEEAPF